MKDTFNFIHGEYAMRNIIYKLSLFIFLMLSTHAFSQVKETASDSVDYYMKHIVVTANRYEKNAFETSIPVNSIHARDIWLSGLDNAGDILQQHAGISYSDAGPWSQKIIVRGLAGPQVLTLVDGMRLDVLRSYGNHAPLVDVNQIERIEVIRGPASMLYGSEAIAGVINYITKRPLSPTGEFEITGNAGVQYASVNNQNSATLTLNSRYKNWGFLLGITDRKADDIDTPKGKLINTAFDGYSLNAKIGAQYYERHFFTLSGSSNRMHDVGVPVNPYASKAKFLKYDRDVVSLNYEYHSSNDFWKRSRLNTYFQQGERNFEAFIDHKPKGALFVNQLLNANRKVKTYGVNAQNSFSISRNNLLTTGIDLFAEYDDTRRIADAAIVNAADIVMKDPPADLTPPTPKSHRSGAGLFIEDEQNLSSRITLTLGARYDHIMSHADGTPGTLTELDMDESDADYSGSLGLLYRLSQNVHLVTNIGRAFKAPTLQERFFSGTAQVGFLNGNPALDSEKSLNIDGGVKWQTGRFSGELNLFRNRIDDYIVMKPVSAAADTFLYDNVGEAILTGGEAYASVNIARQWDVFANSSFVRGNDDGLDTPLPKIPPMQGMLGVRYTSGDENVRVELTTRFVDTQNRVAENESKTDGYTLVNFSSGINLEPVLGIGFPLQLTFNIRNIFDESYRDHLSYVTWWDAPGRNIIIGLKSGF
jgi:hemoglobin/transferrin/lactoferrin receptor protein